MTDRSTVIRAKPRRLGRWRPLTLVIAAFGALTLLSGASAQDTTEADEIRDLAEVVAVADDAGFAWNDALRLARYREKATAHVLEAAELPDATPLGKVALARVLIELREMSRATDLLLGVASSDASVSVRVDAVQLLGESGDSFIEEDLWKLLDETLDPRLRAALSKCLWSLTKELDAKAKLKEFLKSDDTDIRVEGALALAEIGDFNEQVRAVLQEIRYEPTDRGRLAHALLTADEWVSIASAAANRNRETSDGTTPATTSDNPFQVIVEEALRRVELAFVDPQKLDAKTLWEGAARGIVEAVGDPHTSFQTAEERGNWTDNLKKEYGGIGAYVGHDEDGYFIVTRPMFGGPAWDARLQSGDRVLTVNGWETGGEELDDIVKRLRGTPGEDVVIDVQRRGWSKPREMRLTRGFIKVPTVYSDMLPGKVGYVMVDAFAKNTADEFRTALGKLENDHAESLILDLRWNSGGYLHVAQKMADTLLPKGRLVVETEGRQNVYPDEQYVSQGQGTEWSRTVPLRVLVNGASASASEILSGCLQIQERATVVGLRTFGKGSVQNVYPIHVQPFAEEFTDRNGNGQWDEREPFEDLNANDVRDTGERYYDRDRNSVYTPDEEYVDANGNGIFDCPAVKITIAKYFVGKSPGSKDIHPHRKEMIVAGRREWIGGIEPDLAVEGDTLDGWRAEELADLAEAGVFDTYLDEQFEAHRDQFLELAQAAPRDPSAYPGFDELFASLDTRLDPVDVWRHLHIRVRARASDVLGRPLVGDFVLDAQLQRAIRDLAETESAALRDVVVYGPVMEREFEVPPTYDPAALEAARPVR